MSKKDDAQQIAQQARDEFDLGAELQGRSRRTRTVRVYTDEEAGDQLGGIELVTVVDQFGLESQKPRAWGIVKKIADLSADEETEKKNAKAIKALKEEAKVLQARLEDSALEIELHSIPKIIKDDATRAARKALGVNEKINENHPRYDEFTDEYDAQILQRTTESVTKVSTGAVNRGITIETARTLKGMLPEFEWKKIFEAQVELLWQNAISTQAVQDSDF